MSLINEALKKAQRQRSLDAAPLSSAPSGVAAAAVTTHVRAASHRRSHAPVWFGLGLLVLGVGTTVVIMRYGIDSGPAPAPVVAQPAPVSVAATPVVAAPLAVPTPSTTEAAVVLPPIASAPASAALTPAAPQTQTAPATPPLAFVPPSPAVVAAPLATAAATPAPEPAPVAVQPVNIAALGEPERAALVYSFLDTARLTGVRGTGTSARVLMNERVYRLNDIVDAALGLRLSAVRPNLMVFTDAQGKTYEKPY